MGDTGKEQNIELKELKLEEKIRDRTKTQKIVSLIMSHFLIRTNYSHVESHQKLI